MSENEEFQLVRSRKRGKRLPSVIGDYNSPKISAEKNFNVDQLTRKLNEAKEELTASDYVRNVFQSLKKSTTDINDVLCYGLGHFSEKKHARYQLALLLLIKDRFRSNVIVYDPLFFSSEIKYLESIGFRVLVENEEGKRRIESTTLIYLPHCPKQLTNNFLYANWGPGLKNCVLLCNSFKRILESHTDTVLNNTAKYLLRINPFVDEIQLPNSFEDKNIFNDSAIHVFNQDKINSISKSFWEDKEEPKYIKEDIEFIANSVSNKLTL